MKKIMWMVEYNTKRILFEKYSTAVESVQMSFAWGAKINVPAENQLTDSSSIGFSTPNGNWISIKAVPVLTSPISGI